MALALSRFRTESPPLRGPAQRSAGRPWRLGWGWRFQPQHLRLYLGAALAVALVGIGLNALLFQHERRSTSVFGGSAQPPPLVATPPAAPPLAAPPSKPVAAIPPAPPARPAAAEEAPPAAAAPDPITDLLRGESKGDGAHLVAAAQAALVKLGYPVKPDGQDGAATQQALRDFARTHGLPVSTEITPKLVKQLNAAARSPAR